MLQVDRGGEIPHSLVPQVEPSHLSLMAESTERKLGIWGWIAIVVLSGFLLASIVYAVHAWNTLAGVQISTAGWLFLACGVFFTLAVGGGLMALLFYSSRNHYDQ